MGENRRRKSNHQKANTSARQIDRQNKFTSLNSEDSSSNSGNFSHYQEQPHRKEQNIPRNKLNTTSKTTIATRKKVNQKAPNKTKARRTKLQNSSNHLTKFLTKNLYNVWRHKQFEIYLLSIFLCLYFLPFISSRTSDIMYFAKYKYIIILGLYLQ
ncbi:Hypothetical_protein [Hexamita inflata]|uniref:Hypothetical_protein n=1 Tax=Hexamita inflata TaxID=28002 RepID=A0AA86P6U5_9EUKA|nr:Hypothetical protein HINF_LOCUS19090 [Hexamita inflata]